VQKISLKKSTVLFFCLSLLHLMLSAQSGTEENLALKTDKPIEIDGDLRDTDSMYILIDTFDDPAHYLFFAVNFLSAKADGKVTKDGQSADYGWDGEWEPRRSG